MNQGIAFARTTRALEADDFRYSTLGLGAAFVLLAAWIWWIFAARVPQYERATDVRIESGRALAYFSTLNGVHSGQLAFVTLGGERIPARIENISGHNAEIVFLGAEPALTNSSQASAEVETSRVSPATIAFGVLKRGGSKPDRQ